MLFCYALECKWCIFKVNYYHLCLSTHEARKWPQTSNYVFVMFYLSGLKRMDRDRVQSAGWHRSVTATTTLESVKSQVRPGGVYHCQWENNFVAIMSGKWGAVPKCPACDKSVYPVEQVFAADRKPFHRSCIQCQVRGCRYAHINKLKLHLL